VYEFRIISSRLWIVSDFQQLKKNISYKSPQTIEVLFAWKFSGISKKKRSKLFFFCVSFLNQFSVIFFLVHCSIKKNILSFRSMEWGKPFVQNSDYVIVMMTNQMRRESHIKTKKKRKPKNPQNQSKSHKHQRIEKKNQLSVEWKLGCRVMASWLQLW
jgi:hypothetical protein